MYDNSKNNLTVSNLTKIVGKTKILNNISFSLPKGSIVGFLGLNGAGKTTTLKAISKAISIDSGTIKVEDELLKENNKNKVMFLPDTPLVYPVLTGKEYLSFMGDLLNYNLTDSSPFIKDLNLENAIDKRVSNYSLGMKKKLTLIPLLIKKPKVLLLDEFISGIDPVSMRDIKQILKKYISSKNSILFSTHQLDVAQSFCDSILIIHQGEIQTPLTRAEEVLEKHETLEDFFIQQTDIERVC
ncbi:MAG TPA: ABC transporter ATP-binding protein [Bacillota bacterium]